MPRAREIPALPDEIVMGPYTFRVTTDPAILEAVGGASEGKHVAGFSSLEASLIGVGTAAPTSFAYSADTLLHELLHMAFRVSGFEFQSGEHEEATILACSGMLLHCLRENPQVVTYLTHKE